MASCDARRRIRAALLPVGLLALGACAGRYGEEARAERVEASPTTDAVALLAEGLASTMDSAAAAFEAGRRGAAASAMNDARMGADVAAHGAHGERMRALEQVAGAVTWARRVVANGQPELAPDILRQGARLARRAAGTAPEPSPLDPVPELHLYAYVGATVVNARGRQVGEVEGFTGPPAQPTGLVATWGGWQDGLGFIDLGGRQVEIPLSAVVFGPRSLLGHTMVAAVAGPGSPPS